MQSKLKNSLREAYLSRERRKNLVTIDKAEVSCLKNLNYAYIEEDWVIYSNEKHPYIIANEKKIILT